VFTDTMRNIEKSPFLSDTQKSILKNALENDHRQTFKPSQRSNTKIKRPDNTGSKTN